jgi:hypothetical protein
MLKGSLVKMSMEQFAKVIRNNPNIKMKDLGGR